MTSFKKTILATVLAGLGLIAVGCSTHSPKQSSIPWSQPQAWEGQIPGMGQPSGR